MDNNNFNPNMYNTDTVSYDAPAVVPAKGLGIASLILGIVGMLSCMSGCFGLVIGIVGLILAINAKKKGNTTALPTVGLVLSIITLVFAIGSTIFWIVIFAIYGLSIFAVIAEELSLLLL